LAVFFRGAVAADWEAFISPNIQKIGNRIGWSIGRAADVKNVKRS
jgi:hypothetical protein